MTSGPLRAQGRPQSGTKVCALREAIAAHVAPEMHVNFASTPSRSNAAVRELARAFRGKNPRFVISMTGFHSHAHLLPLLRLGRKYVACFFGDNYPVPRPSELYGTIRREGAKLEMWSLWSYVSALRAGALGHAHAVTRSLMGTDMAKDLGEAGIYREIDDPASAGSRVSWVSAIRSDITFVHALMGDKQGNLVFSPPYSEGFWGALGARSGVIATVERVVSHEECARYCDAMRLPPHRVLSVCEESFGAHPQPLYAAARFGAPGYIDDFEHYEIWRELCRDEARFASFARDVLDAEDGGKAYREWVGLDRLEQHSISARTLNDAVHRARVAGVSPSPPARRPRARTSADDAGARIPRLGPRGAHDSDRPDAPARANEILLVLAARKIVERVRARRYPLILAGIGHAFVAARMAKLWLAEEGIKVCVMVETGLFDVECGPASDEFLLSYRNIALAKRLSSVEDVLGTLTCGVDNGCLGVLGAAQIDPTGAVNSTKIGEKLLVGSGGANDIAASAAEVVVLTRCTETRLVPKVDYVTSSGRAVLTVATDLCTFSRSTSDASARWRVGDIYPAFGGYPPLRALDIITKNCTWPFVSREHALERDRERAQEHETTSDEVSDDVEYAPLISTAEMALVHALDPEGIHWRREASRIP
jgi:3-oxoacid CoA-transferase subunit A